MYYTIFAATTPVHIKNVDDNYLNEKVNETEAVFESDVNFLYADRGKLLCSNLETPVLEDIHDYMDMKVDTVSDPTGTDATDLIIDVQRAMHPSHGKRSYRKSDNGTDFMVTTAKRLSDEFSVNHHIYNNEQLANAEDETSLQHDDDIPDNFMPSSVESQQVGRHLLFSFII